MFSDPSLHWESLCGAVLGGCGLPALRTADRRLRPHGTCGAHTGFYCHTHPGTEACRPGGCWASPLPDSSSCFPDQITAQVIQGLGDPQGQGHLIEQHLALQNVHPSPKPCVGRRHSCSQRAISTSPAHSAQSPGTWTLLGPRNPAGPQGIVGNAADPWVPHMAGLTSPSHDMQTSLERHLKWPRVQPALCARAQVPSLHTPVLTHTQGHPGSRTASHCLRHGRLNHTDTQTQGRLGRQLHAWPHMHTCKTHTHTHTHASQFCWPGHVQPLLRAKETLLGPNSWMGPPCATALPAWMSEATVHPPWG